MDISGYSKIIIHHIILSSEFKIENINNEYKCSIKYIYDEKQNTTKEKSLREILETKDKILLRQKRKNEEDKSENEIKQFLQIIDEIEKVLELLETISSKGYIEEINCIITIENGNEKIEIKGNKRYQNINELFFETNAYNNDNNNYNKNSINKDMEININDFNFIINGINKRENKENDDDDKEFNDINYWKNDIEENKNSYLSSMAEEAMNDLLE